MEDPVSPPSKITLFMDGLKVFTKPQATKVDKERMVKNVKNYSNFRKEKFLPSVFLIKKFEE